MITKNNDLINTSQAFQIVPVNLSVTVSSTSGQTTAPSSPGDTQYYKDQYP